MIGEGANAAQPSAVGGGGGPLHASLTGGGGGAGGGGISELKQHLQETESAVNGGADRKQAESELMEVS